MASTLWTLYMQYMQVHSVDERVSDVVSLASSLYHRCVNVTLSGRHTLQRVFETQVLGRQLRVYNVVSTDLLRWSDVVEVRGTRAVQRTCGLWSDVAVLMTRLYVLTVCRTRRHARLSMYINIDCNLM